MLKCLVLLQLLKNGVQASQLRHWIAAQSILHCHALLCTSMLTCLQYAGFSFPNCLGSKTITVNSSNTPAPTGAVTLSINGGMFGDKGGTLGNVSIFFGSMTQYIDHHACLFLCGRVRTAASSPSTWALHYSSCPAQVGVSQ